MVIASAVRPLIDYGDLRQGVTPIQHAVLDMVEAIGPADPLNHLLRGNLANIVNSVRYTLNFAVVTENPGTALECITAAAAQLIAAAERINNTIEGDKPWLPSRTCSAA